MKVDSGRTGKRVLEIQRVKERLDSILRECVIRPNAREVGSTGAGKGRMAVEYRKMILVADE